MTKRIRRLLLLAVLLLAMLGLVVSSVIARMLDQGLSFAFLVMSCIGIGVIISLILSVLCLTSREDNP